MENNKTSSSKIYFMAMACFWLVFGLITIFYPKMMDMFQTQEGIDAKTVFSDHIWRHDGFDIVAFCILLFALSREAVSNRVIRAAAIAALMATLAIAWSLISTPYWNPLFIGSGLGCFSFVVWGFVLAGKK